jgi:hypothetical protein
MLFDASSAATARVTGERVAALLVTLATEKCVAGPLTLNVFDIPVIELETVSVATTISPPEVFSVTEKFPTPLVSVELAGSTAFPSLLVKCTVPE